MRPPLPPFTEARLKVKQCRIANCTKADPAYGAGFLNALGLAPLEVAAE
jgi:catalase